MRSDHIHKAFTIRLVALENTVTTLLRSREGF